jgi:catechol 2,3-dioxygenase-like lactoylglutathione lyase family enzyme
MNRGAALAIAVVALLVGFVAGTQVTHGQAAGAFGRRINHVNIMVRDIDKTVQALADIWGVDAPKITPVDNVPLPPDGKTMGHMRLASLMVDNLRLEIIQPADNAPTPWRDFLEKCGDGIHHIGIDAANAQDTIRYLQSKGGKWTLGSPTGTFGYVDMTARVPFTIEVIQSQPAR